MLCDLDTTGVDRSLFDAAKAKTAAQYAAENTDVVDLGPGSFDQTDLLGGGACVSDLSTTIMGQPFTLSLSSICPYAAMLGNILMAVTLLICIRIVFRG